MNGIYLETVDREDSMTASEDPQDALPLTPLTAQILVALAESPRHGYAVVKAVREATEGRIDPGTGTFYSAIHRMSDEGMIEEVESPAEADDRRRTYSITPFGRAVLAAETERLEALVALARATEKL